MEIDGGAVLHGTLQFLFGAFAAHLIGIQVGLYGWNGLFVAPGNRGRLYTTAIALGAAGLWPQFFPAAARLSVVIQIGMLLGCVQVFFLARAGQKK